MPKKQYTCTRCSKAFIRDSWTVRNESSVYCSRDCYHQSQRKRVNLVCEMCGTPYVRTEKHAARSESKYCSNACQRKAKRTRVLCVCSRCGKEFMRKPSQVAKSKDLYCSRACKNDVCSKVEVSCVTCGKPDLRWPSQTNESETHYCSSRCRQNIDILTCEWCGTHFERHSYSVGERSFCSRSCVGKWRSVTFSGENSPAWKGGWSSYYGPDWNSQSRKARKRDGYACRVCGLKQEDHYRALDVHHIVPFRAFGYIYGENESDKLANDLSNLITVCPSCHGKLDSGSITFQLSLEQCR